MESGAGFLSKKVVFQRSRLPVWVVVICGMCHYNEEAAGIIRTSEAFSESPIPPFGSCEGANVYGPPRRGAGAFGGQKNGKGDYDE